MRGGSRAVLGAPWLCLPLSSGGVRLVFNAPKYAIFLTLPDSMRDAGGFLDISPYLPKLVLLTKLNLLMPTSAFLGLGALYLGLVFALALCCMFIV